MTKVKKLLFNILDNFTKMELVFIGLLLGLILIWIPNCKDVSFNMWYIFIFGIYVLEAREYLN